MTFKLCNLRTSQRKLICSASWWSITNTASRPDVRTSSLNTVYNLLLSIQDGGNINGRIPEALLTDNNLLKITHAFLAQLKI